MSSTSEKPTVLPKPEPRLTEKKQAWAVWICKWKNGRKRCREGKKGKPMRIEGPPALVERSSDQHWAKHLKEAQA